MPCAGAVSYTRLDVYKRQLLYTVVGTAINLAVTVPAGYALSRRELPFHRTIMMFFLFTM